MLLVLWLGVTYERLFNCFRITLFVGCTGTIAMVVTVDLVGVELLTRCLAVQQFIVGFFRLIASPSIGKNLRSAIWYGSMMWVLHRLKLIERPCRITSVS